MMQSLLPAIYPMLKAGLHLDFGQIGLITLANQLTASLLQPVIGLYTDRRPQPYSLAIGMGFTPVRACCCCPSPAAFALVLVAAALVGLGSSVFHPESSRIARLASGGRHGFAQSLFQVGGNAGSSLGPLLAAFIVRAARAVEHRLVLARGAHGASRSSGASAAGTSARGGDERHARRRAGRVPAAALRDRSASRWRFCWR